MLPSAMVSWTGWCFFFMERSSHNKLLHLSGSHWTNPSLVSRHSDPGHVAREAFLCKIAPQPRSSTSRWSQPWWRWRRGPSFFTISLKFIISFLLWRALEIDLTISLERLTVLNLLLLHTCALDASGIHRDCSTPHCKERRRWQFSSYSIMAE